MSWQDQNKIEVTAAQRRLLCSPFTRLRQMLWLVCVGGAFSLFPAGLEAQENPLREGDAGYLQQLLPSLQRIQAESENPAAVAASNPEQGSRFIGQPSSPESFAASGPAAETNLGTWRPEQASPNSFPAQPSPDQLIEGTATGLAPTGAPPTWPVASEATASSAAGLNRINEVSPTAGSPKPTNSGSASGLSGSKSQGLGKLSAFKGVESLQLDSTMVKIGLNTLLVLAASIALIVVVRKGLPKQVAAAAQRQAGRLKVEQSLSLGGKAELKVVRCGLHQILVAMDNGGIKSVVALEPGLETEREHLEPEPENQPPAPLKEPVNIEQFVKMIRDMDGNLLASRPGR